MKLKALKNITVGGKHYITGEIFEVPANYEFETLVNEGYAELVDEDPDEE